MVNHIFYTEKDGQGQRHMAARPVHNREEYIALHDTEQNRRQVAKVQQLMGEGADDGSVRREKFRLEKFAFNDLMPDGKVKDASHPASTFFHDIDLYEGADVEALKEKILGMKEELGLLELSRSVSGGLHLVCRRQPGRTILECQVRVATLLHAEMDTNNANLERIVLATTSDDIYYLDDAIFEEPLTPEQSKQEMAELTLREMYGQEEVPPGAKKADKHYRPWEDIAQSQHKGSNAPAPERSESPSLTGEGSGKGLQTPEAVSPDERVRFIANGVMKEKELTESNFLDEGGRHTTVKIFLCGATQLLTKAEVNGWLRERMPEHWADANIQQLVNDFYANYTNPNQRLLKYQEQLFTQSQRLNASNNAQQGEVESAKPPQMPTKLPKLVQLLTSKTPDIYKAAVAHAVFPSLATHLCNVRFCYTDNVEHGATLMNCLMAGTGAGKGCIDDPIRHIMADIERRDEENERREAEWKKDCQRKGANKDKQVRPEGLVIQVIDADMTKPALVTRMEEAEGHFVYVKLNELDLFEQLKGQTGKQHFQLMCLAFDPGAEYGQTRVGTQSVTARPQCRFNWNACTTILKGRRFFRNVLTDGPISRINFCTIPEEEIGAEQPIYGQYDSAFDEALKPYIDNLCGAQGLIDCPQAFRLAKKLQAECAEFARLSQDEVYWNLSHRACVIAWLKACVLYVANGQKWEKSIEDFVRWSLNYDLWCKMQFFGADIAKASSGDGARIGTRGPRNLLELLPDEFTLDDAKRVRQQQDMSNEAHKCQKMIRTWVNRGYVIQNTEYSFKKSVSS